MLLPYLLLLQVSHIRGGGWWGVCVFGRGCVRFLAPLSDFPSSLFCCLQPEHHIYTTCVQHTCNMSATCGARPTLVRAYVAICCRYVVHNTNVVCCSICCKAPVYFILFSSIVEAAAERPGPAQLGPTQQQQQRQQQHSRHSGGSQGHGRGGHPARGSPPAPGPGVRGPAIGSARGAPRHTQPTRHHPYPRSPPPTTPPRTRFGAAQPLAPCFSSPGGG